MRPFLAGFCSELIKTAFADPSSPTPPPVPATGSPTTQRPTGAAAAPARPSQQQGPYVATYRHAAKPEPYRPSPKYTPKPGTPDEKPAAKGGGGSKAPPSRMPWSTEVRRKEGGRSPGFSAPDPVKKVAPGQKMGVTGATTNKDLYESGAMPKGVYDKLKPQERTSSHVPERGPYSRPKQTSVTAKEWSNPNDFDQHTGRMTPRARYQVDNPMQTGGLRGGSGKGSGYAIPTVGEHQAPQKPWNSRFQADSDEVKKWMSQNDQIKVGPQETSWGQDDTWQNRGAVNQFATAQDLTKDKK